MRWAADPDKEGGVRWELKHQRQQIRRARVAGKCYLTSARRTIRWVISQGVKHRALRLSAPRYWMGNNAKLG